MNSEEKILITGASGFIGYYLSKRLLKDEFSVIGIDNINEYYDINLKYARLKELGIDHDQIEYNKAVQSEKYPNFTFIKLNLEDAEGMAQLFENYKIDKVCNLGAQAGVRYSIENPMAYVTSNIIGFTNLMEQSCLHHVGHVVYASSSSVYGLNSKMPFSTHDATNHPVSYYAATKKANELMAHVYSKLYNLPTTGLRFFTVYGPWGRPDMSPMLFADAIMNEKPLKVFNNGDMGRDFTYVEDIVEGVFRVLQKPATANNNWDSSNPDPSSSNVPYRIYNIGNSNPVRLLDYIETLETALDKKAIKEFLPMQAGDVMNTYSDVDDLERDFDFRPNTSLKDGLDKFANWYKSYYNF